MEANNDLYSINARLTYYCFNETPWIDRDGLRFSWFFYDDETEEARPFTYKEVKAVLGYMVQNIRNFPEHTKNYHLVEGCDINDDLYLLNERHPNNVILREKPSLPGPNSDHDVSIDMDIMLTDENGTDRHKYDLPFSIIGRVEW